MSVQSRQTNAIGGAESLPTPLLPLQQAPYRMGETEAMFQEHIYSSFFSHLIHFFGLCPRRCILHPSSESLRLHHNATRKHYKHPFQNLKWQFEWPQMLPSKFFCFFFMLSPKKKIQTQNKTPISITFYTIRWTPGSWSWHNLVSWAVSLSGNLPWSPHPKMIASLAELVDHYICYVSGNIASILHPCEQLEKHHILFIFILQVI
jgi:hypothetical protein